MFSLTADVSCHFFLLWTHRCIALICWRFLFSLGLATAFMAQHCAGNIITLSGIRCLEFIGILDCGKALELHNISSKYRMVSLMSYK